MTQSIRSSKIFLKAAGSLIGGFIGDAIGTPTEGAFDGTEMAYEVRYDESNITDQVLLLKKK